MHRKLLFCDSDKCCTTQYFIFDDEKNTYVCEVCGQAEEDLGAEIKMDPDDDWLNPKKDDIN